MFFSKNLSLQIFFFFWFTVYILVGLKRSFWLTLWFLYFLSWVKKLWSGFVSNLIFLILFDLRMPWINYQNLHIIIPTHLSYLYVFEYVFRCTFVFIIWKAIKTSAPICNKCVYLYGGVYCGNLPEMKTFATNW